MIYFILPIYNEKDHLAELIAGIRSLMVKRNCQIVAVNDGSSDGSLEILERLKGPDLVLAGSRVNMNIGAVFSEGIATVLKTAQDDDVMFIMESDQTSELGLVLPMIDLISKEKQDVVIASRYLPGGRYVNFPLARQVFSYCANGLMRQFFPVQRVFDYTIFFRAYRVGVICQAVEYFGIFGLIQSKGFVANAELVIKLALFTDRIVEIPFVYNYAKKKGASKLNVLRTINEYFVLIFYLKRLLRKFSDYQKRQRKGANA